MPRNSSASTPGCKPPEPTASPVRDAAPDAYALCGRILGAYGVRGWLRVFSHTRPRDNLIRYPAWQLRRAEQRRDVTLETARREGRGLVAKLRGIDDRDQAAALREQEIWIDAALFAPLPDGEYYQRELLGLQACDQHDRTLGQVRDILETGAHDVLVIQGEQEYLVPYAPGRTVLNIDLAQGRIKVRWDGIAE